MYFDMRSAAQGSRDFSCKREVLRTLYGLRTLYEGEAPHQRAAGPDSGAEDVGSSRCDEFGHEVMNFLR